uniref:Uncharacterized protein n=1 Tax=Anopheles atroparvus TaxID=41427 RepID=A0AAG5DRW2_ANOAO
MCGRLFTGRDFQGACMLVPEILFLPCQWCVGTCGGSRWNWSTVDTPHSQPMEHGAVRVLVHLHQQRIVDVLVVALGLLQLEVPRPDGLVVAVQQLVVEATGDALVQELAERVPSAGGGDERDSLVGQQHPDGVDQLRAGLVEEQAVGGQDELVVLLLAAGAGRRTLRRLLPLEHGRLDRAVELVQHQRLADVLHRQLVAVGDVDQGRLAVLGQHQPGQARHAPAELEHPRALELGEPGEDVVRERLLRRPHADVARVVEPDQLARRPGALRADQAYLQPVPVVQPVHVHVLVLLVARPVRLDQVELEQLVVLARVVPERLRQQLPPAPGVDRLMLPLFRRVIPPLRLNPHALPGTLRFTLRPGRSEPARWRAVAGIESVVIGRVGPETIYTITHANRRPSHPTLPVPLDDTERSGRRWWIVAAVATIFVFVVLVSDRGDSPQTVPIGRVAGNWHCRSSD